MIDTQRIKQVDLKGFLSRHYGLSFNSRGFTHCPFHTPDNIPSFKVVQNNGQGIWYDFHCQGDKENFSSDIIGFVMRKDGIPFVEASKKIEELEGLKKPTIKTPVGTSKEYVEIPEGDILRIFHYHDESGNVLYQKIRVKETSPHFKDGKFSLRIKKNGKWARGCLEEEMKNIPYKLHKIKNEHVVYLCEGERDAVSLVALGYQATTAPWGKGNWRNKLTPYFIGKEVNIVYHVGNEKDAYKAAEKLSQSCNPWILSIPLKEREGDITDYLSQFPDNETRKRKFEEEILHNKEKFSIEQKESKDSNGAWAQTIRFIKEELDYAQRFSLSELCLYLGITGAEDRKKVVKAISHSVSKGDVTRGERLGTYRKADAKLVAIPLLEEDEDEGFREFRIPILENYIKVERGDVLLFAGYTSTGKTCYALNFILLNQHLFEGTDYFSNQYGQVKRRVVSFKNHDGLTKKDWKFNLYERTENFAAVMNPEHLTIIDFLSATDGDYCLLILSVR